MGQDSCWVSLCGIRGRVAADPRPASTPSRPSNTAAVAIQSIKIEKPDGGDIERVSAAGADASGSNGETSAERSGGQVEPGCCSTAATSEILFTVLCVVVLPGLLASCAAVAALGLEDGQRLWAWYGIGILFQGVLVYAGAAMYFGRLEFTTVQAMFLALAACVHVACHAVAIVQFGSDGTVLLGLLFAAFMYPASVLAIAAVYMWSDSMWDLPAIYEKGVLCDMFRCCGQNEDTQGNDADAPETGRGLQQAERSDDPLGLQQYLDEIRTRQ